MALRYRPRSHCARGAHTAGPLLLLSIRNCSVARSVARPMIPPRASTSRTTVPFATPPIAGLHDICPMLSSALVTSPTRAPSRAAATAASVPAWPAPTTRTSNCSSSGPKRAADGMIKPTHTSAAEGANIFREQRPRSQCVSEGAGRMAREIPAGQAMLFIRRDAYERAGVTRAAIDERLNLTPDEFNVDGQLVAIGPLPDDAALRELFDELEEAGLVYFDDYFELSGIWPEWLRLYVDSR